MTFVALLRGINVGGKNAVAMGRLKACLEGLGFADVTTYINSGNVIFSTARTSSRKLEATIENALESEFGFAIRVLVRDAREMDRLAESIPKAWRGSKTLRCYVIFLSPSIAIPSIRAILRPKEGADEVLYLKDAVLWATPFKALTRTGLQRVTVDPIYKEMTIRNVNTTLKINDLMHPAMHGE